MATIHVDIVSAESSIFSGRANMVFAPAEMGEIGIAPRHSPLITRLGSGEIRVQAENGEEQTFFVSGGVLEVQPSMVTVLADTALRAKDIDEAAALKAKREAEEALAERKGDIDMARAQAELAEAVARLKFIENVRRKTR
ncbi:MAG TPA: F0F1 ATP synthase subunit epsilon [Gammaproteobacteria bacterium]